MSTDGGFNLYQVLRKYLERYQSYGADTNDGVLTDRMTADGRMDGLSKFSEGKT